MVNFGIIGYGYMGHVHQKNLEQLEDVKLIAVCDINQKELEDVPAEILTYTDAERLLENSGIDVVIIAANNNQHLELVKKAARAGKDIICEKPAAMSTAELDEMVRVVEECGVSFTVHQQRRYDKDFRTVKEVYDKKMIGDVYTIHSSLYGFNGYMHDWHVKKSEGGGMLYDWGVHLLDQILWLTGSRVKSVYAALKNVINEEVDDYFNITLKFENGVMAQIELGTYYLSDRPGWFSRHWFMGGSQGTIYTDGMNPKGNIVKTTTLRRHSPGRTEAMNYGPTRSFGPAPEGLIVTQPIPEVSCEHLDYFRNYLRAREGKEEMMITIPEVRRVLALMEAVMESSASGKSVDFE